MRKVLPFVLALLLMAAALPAYAQEAEPNPTASGGDVSGFFGDLGSSLETWALATGDLEVRGQAVRTVEPDTVTIRIGAKVEELDEGTAQQGANKIMNEVIEVLRALGVEDKQMQTSGYNITRKYSTVGRRSIPSGYIARISLVVKIQDFDLINEVLDIAVEKGANEVGNIEFSYSDEGAVYRQALTDAIAAARAKADVMAEAAGVRIVSLKTLREDGYGGAYVNSYAPREAMADEADTGTQIMAGELEINANVTMIFEVK